MAPSIVSPKVAKNPPPTIPPIPIESAPITPIDGAVAFPSPIVEFPKVAVPCLGLALPMRFGRRTQRLLAGVKASARCCATEPLSLSQHPLDERLFTGKIDARDGHWQVRIRHERPNDRRPSARCVPETPIWSSPRRTSSLVSAGAYAAGLEPLTYIAQAMPLIHVPLSGGLRQAMQRVSVALAIVFS